jgi:excisionase family DNA binding protein
VYCKLYERLLTVPQAAGIMQISKSKAYAMAKNREIPVVSLGGNIRIPEQAFRDYLRNKTEFNGRGFHSLREQAAQNAFSENIYEEA